MVYGPYSGLAEKFLQKLQRLQVDKSRNADK